jgi:intein/homing endonuclease
MSVIVGVEDVLKTFSLEEQESARQYFAYEKLREQHPEWGYKRLAKALGVKIARTRWWKQKNGKPCAIKTIERLTVTGLLPFESSDSRFECVLRMLGSLYGDGGVDASLNNIFFSSSDLHDIETWKMDLLTVFPVATKNLDLIESGEFGHGNCLRCTNRALIRFFAALGAPIGSKVIHDNHLPRWIFSIDSKDAVWFLDGFLACEVSPPQFWYSSFRGKNYVHNFSFSLSKWEALEENHLGFLLELKKLLARVGVKALDKTRKDVHLKWERKDLKTTFSYRVFISTSLDNVRAFNSAFELRYAVKKKEKLEAVLKRATSFHEELVESKAETNALNAPAA